jgi:SOS response regulatory protein OraA/RecX
LIRSGREGAAGGGQSALAAALRLLARRALSVCETERRLRARGYAPAEIDAALDSLRSQRYLDDGTLAYNAASSGARKLHGRARVAAMLRERGIPDDLIPGAIAAAYEDLDEEELARRAAARAFAALGPDPDERARAKVARALFARGFSARIAHRAAGLGEAAGPARERGGADGSGGRPPRRRAGSNDADDFETGT